MRAKADAFVVILAGWLDNPPPRGILCAPHFKHHVESLRYYRFEAHARQRYSPPGYGQEERRRWPARHQKRAAMVRPKPSPASNLGAGAEEVCQSARHSARVEDDQQEWRLQSAEESRRDLTRSGFEFRLSASADFGRFFFVGRAKLFRAGLFIWFRR
jgi:hypothetical protein